MVRRSPGFLDPDTMLYRIEFIQEELDELKTAYGDRDLAKAADALVDIVWVTLGLADKMGLPWDALWWEVYQANMRKVLATKPHPTRGALETIAKPDGWREPNIAAVLQSVADDEVAG